MQKKQVKIILYIFLFFFISTSFVLAKESNMQDSILFEKYIKDYKNQESLSIGELVANTALFFRGKPYVSSTLESIGEKESLVINLREFDCNTFVENCIALAFTLKTKNKSFSDFKSILQTIRYRSGYIDGYASRLHYVTDWKTDNYEKNILTDISLSLGGVAVQKKIDFMSTHPDLYKELESSPSFLQQIKYIEKCIQSNNNYIVINKIELDKLTNKIEDGDIIAFATSIAGLDYSHIAIAYRSKLGLSFIHASTRTMSVIEEPQLLYDYCMKSKKCTGISVFRLNNLYL